MCNEIFEGVLSFLPNILMNVFFQTFSFNFLAHQSNTCNRGSFTIIR